MKHPYIIIMAGGVGSRFWPLSRTPHPKQFLDILGTGKTMIQQTYERFLPLSNPKNIYVVTNQIYVELVKKQLPEISDNQILAEPVARNTAPCIAYASYKIAKLDPQAVTVVTPSDHVIQKEDDFREVINHAILAAHKDPVLVTLGIKPRRPDTGYGYIQFMEKDKRKTIRKVKTFTEKPAKEIAETFLQSGDFLWNSGMFIWSVKTIIDAFEKHLPQMAEIFEEGSDSYHTKKENEFITKTYSLCKNVSIDIGIMEKATNTYVIPGDFDWSDVGTWNALYELHQQDEQGNALDGNMLLFETSNSIIKLGGEKLAVIQGLKDYIVAEADGILLICHRGQEQRIKDFVAALRLEKWNKYV